MHAPVVVGPYEASLEHQRFIERLQADILQGNLVVMLQAPEAGRFGNRRVVPCWLLDTREGAEALQGWTPSPDPAGEVAALNEATKQIMACWN
jgi:hypothetical protein